MSNAIHHCTWCQNDEPIETSEILTWMLAASEKDLDLVASLFKLRRTVDHEAREIVNQHDIFAGDEVIIKGLSPKLYNGMRARVIEIASNNFRLETFDWPKGKDSRTVRVPFACVEKV